MTIEGRNPSGKPAPPPAAGTGAGATRRPGSRRLLLLALLAAMAALAFGRAARNDFLTFDDDVYVLNNPNVTAGLSWAGAAWAFTANYASNWHPLTWLSHMLDVSLFGLSPGEHHLVSLAWHILAAGLLFATLEACTGARWESWVASAWFAVHPLRVESVAWVAERKDVLGAFFYVLALLMYLRYARCPGTARYLALGAVCALGLMTKPMLVTLPLTLGLLDYWPLGRFVIPGARRRLVLEKLPLLAMAGAVGLVTYFSQQQEGGLQSTVNFPPAARMANACWSYVAYIGQSLWPGSLAPFYPHAGPAFPAWKGVAAAVALAAATGVVFRLRRRYLIVGWLWYLVTLLPVIGLIQVGNQALADRYTYLPSVGLGLMGVWGLFELRSRRTALRRPAAAATAAVLAALILLSWLQTGWWRDGVTLFTRTIQVTKDNWLAHNNLGMALARQGRVREEIAAYRRALAIAPGYIHAHNNLGVALSEIGDIEGATRHFRRVRELKGLPETVHGGHPPGR